MMCYFMHYSQSLFTLNLIEEYLSKMNVPTDEYEEKWCKNKNYFSKFLLSFAIHQYFSPSDKCVLNF